MNKITLGKTGLVIEKNGLGCLPIQRISEQQTAYLKAHYPAEYMAALMTRRFAQITEITKLTRALPSHHRGGQGAHEKACRVPAPAL